VFIDKSEKPITFAENPLNRPGPTAVGVAAISFVIVTTLAGMNNEIAKQFNVSIGVLTTPLLIICIAVPILYGLIVYFMLRRRLERKGETTSGAQAQPGD
jgi:cytochrome b-561